MRELAKAARARQLTHVDDGHTPQHGVLPSIAATGSRAWCLGHLPTSNPEQLRSATGHSHGKRDPASQIFLRELMTSITLTKRDSVTDTSDKGHLPRQSKGQSSAPERFADFDSIRPGDEAEFVKIIDQRDVDAFAELTGDFNPLHMIDDFANRTQFQRRVVHGMLVASYISTLVGMRCPGSGALWTQQNFRWRAPVFIGDKLHLKLQVMHKSLGSRTLTIQVRAANQTEEIVMDGDGVVTVLEERPRAQSIPIAQQVAFITGASHGIGAAIAVALAEAGAQVVITHCASELNAQEVCARIRSNGGRAVAVQADIRDRVAANDAIKKAEDTYERPISILINNPGTVPGQRPFTEMTWEEVQSSLNEHVQGTFHCCQAVIPGMKSRNCGRIFNIGYALRHRTPTPKCSGFLMAEAALHALTRCLAVELGPDGIRVNMLTPGPLASRPQGPQERVRKLQAMQAPLRELPTDEDVAAAVVAFCGTAGDFITGAELPVCAGLQI